MIWKYLEQNDLFPKDFNWVQHELAESVYHGGNIIDRGKNNDLSVHK